jgi:GNAT superfamily N-acetyltransferase
VATDLGVPHPWSVSLHLPFPGSGDGPSHVPDEHLDAALAWCAAAAGGRGWAVHVSSQDGTSARRLGSRGLTRLDALPVLALAADAVAGLRAPTPSGIEVDLSPAHADVVAGYGAWMQDVALAARLVRPDDLRSSARRFVVARAGEQPQGCALVWLAGGTLAVSGLGVAPQWRGRGVGAALVASSSRLGQQADPGADVAWMHATDQGAGLYRAMGFSLVDEHVRLGVPPG